MTQVFNLKVLLAYHEECNGFSMAEAVEYLVERAKEFTKRPSLVTENLIKSVLFEERYGKDSIPIRIWLVMSGVFANFDTMTDEDRTEHKLFNERWDKMFA